MSAAFDENSVQTETVDFDYGPEEDAPTQADIDAAVAAFQKLLEWVWQSGPKNINGLEIRAMICCWIFLKHLRPLSLTQVSRMSDRDKQSLGRWVDDFKRQFPEIKTNHMKIQ